MFRADDRCSRRRSLVGFVHRLRRLHLFRDGKNFVHGGQLVGGDAVCDRRDEFAMLQTIRPLVNLFTTLNRKSDIHEELSNAAFIREATKPLRNPFDDLPTVEEQYPHLRDYGKDRLTVRQISRKLYSAFIDNRQKVRSFDGWLFVTLLGETNGKRFQHAMVRVTWREAKCDMQIEGKVHDVLPHLCQLLNKRKVK
jgi:hypothetical protein